MLLIFSKYQIYNRTFGLRSPEFSRALLRKCIFNMFSCCPHTYILFEHRMLMVKCFRSINITKEILCQTLRSFHCKATSELNEFMLI